MRAVESRQIAMRNLDGDAEMQWGQACKKEDV